jgi:hypothetical protein
MNTKEALEQYNTIASKIFSKKNKKHKYKDGAFRASTLEAEMKRAVAAYSNGNDSLRMLDEAATTGTGRAYDSPILKRKVGFRRRTFSSLFVNRFSCVLTRKPYLGGAFQNSFATNQLLTSGCSADIGCCHRNLLLGVDCILFC